MNKFIYDRIHYLYFAVSIAFYYFFAFKIERAQFELVFFIYSILFALYLLLVKNKSNYLFLFGVLSRIVLLFSIPNLSQDIYRFIWDGRLILEGINPLTSRPNELQHLPNAAWFISKMGNLSASNYSNYPPLAQYVFAIVAFLGHGNVILEIIFFKFILVLADVVTFKFGQKILEKLTLDSNRIFYYFLNPLVILEGIANAHFEVLMIMFFCLGSYYLISLKQIKAGVFIALAISTKLIPIFYLASQFRFSELKNRIWFYMISFLVLVGSFLPYFNVNFLNNYSSTIGLWFGKFEFNGSLYILIRELGFKLLGYNINALYGKSLIVFLVLFLLWQMEKFKKIIFFDSFVHFQTFLLLYFLCSTTVHPWYVITLVFLNVFHIRLSVIIWSFTIILSYFAYNNLEFKEYPLVLILEYGLVWPLFILETIKMYRNIEKTSTPK